MIDDDLFSKYSADGFEMCVGGYQKRQSGDITFYLKVTLEDLFNGNISKLNYIKEVM